MNPHSLEKLCYLNCERFLRHSLNEKVNESKLKIIQLYLNSTFPRNILIRLSLQCHYYFHSNLTIIFLPALVSNGSLKLNGMNSRATLKWIFQYTECQELIKESLTKLTVTEHSVGNYFSLLKLLSLTPKLKTFEITSLTGDDALAILSSCCKELEIFDAKEDSGCTVSDAGLGFLSQLKHLKIVLFSNLSDEYDHEDQFHFTAKGLAMLILSLPCLQRIECPEYLLRDALQYAYQFKEFKDNSLVLKCLLLNYADIPASTISILPYLCPLLTTLAVMVPSNKEKKIIANALQRLNNISRLCWNLESCTDLSNLGLPLYGHRLEYLFLHTHSLSEDDIYILDSCCTNLKTLILNLHSFGYEPSRSVPIDAKPASILPCLETLEIKARISVSLFILLNAKCSNLRFVYCEQTVIVGWGEAFFSVLKAGGWQNLEVLVLPRSSNLVSEFLCSIVVCIKKLNLVCCTFANDHEELKFNMFVQNNLMTLQCMDCSNIVAPSKEMFAIEQ